MKKIRSDNKTPYKSITCSVVGYRKAVAGKVCEDAFKVARVAGGSVYIAAVADGHGDSKCIFADTGAKIAVSVACRVLKEYAQTAQGKSEKDISLFWNSNRSTIARLVASEFETEVLEDFRKRCPSNMSEEETTHLIDFVRAQSDADDKSKNALTSDNHLSAEEIRESFSRKKKLGDRLNAVMLLYGTTLRASVVGAGYIFSFTVGDGDSVICSDTEKTRWLLPKTEAFDCETYSMCEEYTRLCESFLFSFVNISPRRTNGGFTDSYADADILFLSTDGFRNSFIDDGLFCDKISEICARVASGKQLRSATLKRLLDNLSRNSVFGDDITVVIIAIR